MSVTLYCGFDLLVIGLSSLENVYLNFSLNILTSVICPSVVALKDILHVLDINPLLDIWFTNIFLHLVGCLFSLLIVFSSTKVFIVPKFNLFFFSFLKLVLSLWNHCRTQSQENLCLSFPLRSLILALIFRYFIYFEKFYIWCEVVVQLSFLYMIFSCSSIICEQYYFSIIMAPSSQCP